MSFDREVELAKAVLFANAEKERDLAFWEAIERPGDSDEIEFSGYIDGFAAGLSVAQQILDYGIDWRKHMPEAAEIPE